MEHDLDLFVDGGIKVVRFFDAVGLEMQRVEITLASPQAVYSFYKYVASHSATWVPFYTDSKRNELAFSDPLKFKLLGIDYIVKSAHADDR